MTEKLAEQMESLNASLALITPTFQNIATELKAERAHRVAEREKAKRRRPIIIGFSIVILILLVAAVTILIYLRTTQVQTANIGKQIAGCVNAPVKPTPKSKPLTCYERGQSNQATAINILVSEFKADLDVMQANIQNGTHVPLPYPVTQGASKTNG